MTERRSDRLGTYFTSSSAGETVRAYLPPPLPPEPGVDLGRFYGRIDAANRALGQLGGIASVLPDPLLFLYMYVRKEALLSSQIEGTQSSFSELLAHESDAAPGVPTGDVQEVSNYVAAAELGVEMLGQGLPISVRLLKNVHARLLRTGRGSSQAPGEFRRSQNWVGGTRPGNALYVPPAPHQVGACMSDLERFINDGTMRLPLLVRAAFAHVQFETIHPFLDGNGRLGRLLITLMLHDEGVLDQPLLYLSLHFKAHRQTYYDLLQRVRTHGEWERWLDFFLDGVETTARQAAGTAMAVLDRFAADRATIESLGRPAGSALQVHHYLQRNPIASVRNVVKALLLSPPTVRKSIDHLVKAGILREGTGQRRDRRFVYHEYLGILSQGTEPL